MRTQSRTESSKHSRRRAIRAAFLATMALALSIPMQTVACADTGRLSLGATCGGYGLSAVVESETHYYSRATPALGISCGLRLHKYVRTELRFEHANAPLKAVFNYGDADDPNDALELGTLRTTTFEWIPAILEIPHGPKWLFRMMPFSLRQVRLGGSVRPDVWVVIPDIEGGATLFRVLDLNTGRARGWGLAGLGIERALGKRWSIGLETWLVRGCTPSASLDVYELGEMFSMKVEGHRKVLPISLGLKLWL